MLSLHWTCAVPSPHLQSGHRRRVPPAAKKTDPPKAAPRGRISISGLLPSKSLLAKSAIVIFTLGFVDAGYSGDWSRIGAVSKETEELLKMAVYLVVPLSIFLLFFLSVDRKGTED